MALEVEMKAWVRDIGQMRMRLDETCVFEHEYTKKDIYLYGPGGKPADSWAHWNNDGRASDTVKDFRVRIEESGATCTFKDRRLVEQMEVNREIEFAVSDARSFLELAARLGCTVFSCKVKRGLRYGYRREDPDAPALTVELSTIDGLGSFLEVECVLGDGAADPDIADREVRLFFSRVGVGLSDVEDTPYAKLLLDHRIDQCREIEELSGFYQV